MTFLFSEIEREFYLFMKQKGPNAPKSKSNYFSWLRFIDSKYGLNTELTKSRAEFIISELDKTKDQRAKYTKDNDISNFQSALNKFLDFLDSGNVSFEDVESKNDESEIKKIQESVFSETEKMSLIKSRLGQGEFRNRVINKFNSECIFSKCQKIDILIASHIKPWSVSSNEERLDENNGILFLPTYDKLFDKGYISFDSDGKIITSELLTDDDLEKLKLPSNVSFNFNENQLQYLEYHREKVFME